jgi:hypothetical protein
MLGTMSDVFISYARADGVDGLVRRFAADLAEELRARSGVNTIDGLVFRDVAGIEIGETYETVLRRELRSCKAFVALLSPTYVERPACETEWAAFAWRLERAGSPPLLFPICWRYFEPLPPMLAKVQNAHESLGETYAREGLRFLVETRPAEYKEFVFRLAERLHDAMKAHPLPVVELPAFGELAHVFADVEIPRPKWRPRVAAAVATSVLGLAAGAIGWSQHARTVRARAALDEFVASYCAKRVDEPPSPPEIVRRLGNEALIGSADHVVRECPFVALAILDRLPSENASSWKIRGRAFYELNQPARALEAFQRAPREAEVIHNIARCKRILGLAGYNQDMRDACHLGDRTACEAIE